MTSQNESVERNREILTAAAQAIFIDRDLEKFAGFISDEQYIQHHIGTPDGKAAAVAFLEAVMQENTDTTEIVHILVDGDLGMVYSDVKDPDGNPRGSIVDMWRIRDGKFVEHWDVLSYQPVLSS